MDMKDGKREKQRQEERDRNVKVSKLVNVYSRVDDILPPRIKCTSSNLIQELKVLGAPLWPIVYNDRKSIFHTSIYKIRNMNVQNTNTKFIPECHTSH